MTDPASRVANDTDALRSAAERLHRDALDPACATLIPSALSAVEEVLTTLSRICYAAAHSFIPLGDRDDSVAHRYARAATTWPSPRDGIAPSYEQQAQILASLHDAGASLRIAAGRCNRAAGNLTATMEPVESLSDGRSERRSVLMDDIQHVERSRPPTITS